MVQVVVTCPHCSTKLQIQRTTTAAVQFKCSRCGQVLKLAARNSDTVETASTPQRIKSQRVDQPQRPASKAPSNELSDLDFGQLPPAPQHHYSSPNYAAGRPTQGMNWKPLLISLACLFGAAGLGLIGFAAFRWLPKVVSVDATMDALRQLNPVGDSHTSVLRELNDIASNMVGVLESIQDDSGRRAALDKLNALSNEARELQSRATQLGEVDDQEFERLVTEFNSVAADSKERVRTALANLRQRNQASNELAEASMSIAFAMSDVATAIQISWKKLPAPENKVEELVRSEVEIQRDIWRQFVAVTSKERYDKLAERLASFPGRYQQLRNLQKEVVAQSPSSSEDLVRKYRDVSFDIAFQTGDLKSKQAALYGSNRELQAQLDAIQQAEAELIGMKVISQSQPHNGMPMANGPQRPGIYTAPRDVPRTEGDAFSHVLSQFIQRHGAENTVILRIKSTNDLRPKSAEIVDKVAAIPANELGNKPKNFFAGYTGKTTTIVFAYKGPVDEVAARIDFGRVSSVDSQIREILVDYAD